MLVDFTTIHKTKLCSKDFYNHKIKIVRIISKFEKCKCFSKCSILSMDKLSQIHKDLNIDKVAMTNYDHYCFPNKHIHPNKNESKQKN